MAIKITNYQSGEILNIPLPLLIGEVIVSGDSKIFVENLTLSSDAVAWPVINGKFKALTYLKEGNNEIQIKHKTTFLRINLSYKPLKCSRFVRLVYIKCIDDDGLFQAPSEENNSVSSACNRITLGAQMLQTFAYDKFKDHHLPKKTFRLEEQDDKVVCHVFTSSLRLNEAYSLNEEQLWSHFAVELMNSNLRVGNNCKFLAFLSFTRYQNTLNKLPKNHKEILQMTKGQVALGGGGLALFGSGCLHTWPETIKEVAWRFGDRRKIDRMKLMDDSANRYFFNKFIRKI